MFVINNKSKNYRLNNSFLVNKKIFMGKQKINKLRKALDI